MRRVLIFLVLAVLLAQPSLWTWCATHCEGHSHTAASASVSEDCHRTASASSVSARLSAHDGCSQPSTLDAEPLAEFTRHDASSAARLMPATVAIAHVTLAPLSPDLGTQRAFASFSLAPPRSSAPLVLRI